MTPLRQGDTKSHNHSHTIIDPIKGLCWNDGCVIVAPCYTNKNNKNKENKKKQKEKA
jgi:hypothetical protein